MISLSSVIAMEFAGRGSGRALINGDNTTCRLNERVMTFFGLIIGLCHWHWDERFFVS